MINVILTVLADEELRDIFNMIKEKPVSAQEILRHTKLPHTSFYRKINWMLDNKLVIIDSVQETKMVKNILCLELLLMILLLNYNETL